MITTNVLRLQDIFLLLLNFGLAFTSASNIRNNGNRNAAVPPPPAAAANNLVLLCTPASRTIEVSVNQLPGLVQNGASVGACPCDGVIGSDGECYDCNTCPNGYDTGCTDMRASTCDCFVSGTSGLINARCSQRACSRMPEMNFNEGKPSCLAGQQQQEEQQEEQPPPLAPGEGQGQGQGQGTDPIPPLPPPLAPLPPPPANNFCSNGALSNAGKCYSCDTCPSGYNDGCNDCFCDANGPTGCTEKFCNKPGQPSCNCKGTVSGSTGQCYDCNTCPNGYNDGCNDCYCNGAANGTPAGCTEKYCFLRGEPKCM